MMISTRGRYALRVLADLAEHRSEGFVPMKGVAARQEISLKYMEKILPVLTKNHIVDGIQGKGRRLPAEPGAGRIHAGRDPAADGRIPCAGSLLRVRREDLPPGGELSDAAGLERAGQTHQRVLRQRDAGRFGEKVKRDPGGADTAPPGRFAVCSAFAQL